MHRRQFRWEASRRGNTREYCGCPNDSTRVLVLAEAAWESTRRFVKDDVVQRMRVVKCAYRPLGHDCVTEIEVMGAKLWHHAAPWCEDPREALHVLQARVLRENHDLGEELEFLLEGARKTVRLCEVDDKYNLLDHYRRELKRLEKLAQAPIPQAPRECIALLRRIHVSSGQGIGSVLDVTTVSYRGGQHRARRLKMEEVHRFCGVARPDLKRAIAAVDTIHEQLLRGESVCFKYYPAKGDRPVGWYFVGNTID